MRNRKSNPLPLKVSIFLLVTGLLLGCVFTFGGQYWNKKVTRDSCTVINTNFLSYDEKWHHKPNVRVAEIAIDCTDGNRYFIDGVSIDEQLQMKLSTISKNEDITLLIHPNSNTIVEFSSNHGVILSFDETINKLEGESSGFFYIGLFMYFCALVGAYYVVFHVVRKRKK